MQFVVSATGFCYLKGKQKTCRCINRGVERRFTEIHSLSHRIKMSSHLERRAPSWLP